MGNRYRNTKKDSENMLSMNYAVVVPTYNPGKEWVLWVESVIKQSVQPVIVVVVDSSSTDGYVGSCEPESWHIEKIEAVAFNHGGTRNLGFKIAESFNVDFVVAMTQDSILESSNSIEHILLPFTDQSIAAVCGRQLARSDANVRARFARVFNYPSVSYLNKRDDIKKRGIKVAFMSNSFAAYRLSAFNEVGRFPERIIFGEDMYIASKFIMAGWNTYYNAEACAVHSHDYSLIQDFKRYFDIGVFHKQTSFLYKQFGKPSGEGLRFLLNEFVYVFSERPWCIPSVLAEVISKYVGHKLGLSYRYIPRRIRSKIGLNKKYWMNE